MVSMKPLDLLNKISRRTLADEITDRLRDATRAGQIPLGTRLYENEIAAQMGVSRVPVREAIRCLSAEGLVKTIPHRGTFVYRPTRREFEQIASIRVLLEQFVVERVLARWTPECEARLSHIVNEMEQAARLGHHQVVFELDTEFHETLWEIADHDVLLETVSSLRVRISRFLYEATMAVAPDGLGVHVSGHRKVVDALACGDLDRTREVVRDHILTAKDRVMSYCEWPEGTNSAQAVSLEDGDTC